MTKVKKVIIIFTALLIAETVCFLVIINNLHKENMELSGKLSSPWQLADREEYYLNDGLYYLNGDPESCYVKIEQRTFQLIWDNEEQLRRLYQQDIAERYKPDSNNYKDFDEWIENMSDQWEVSRTYYLLLGDTAHPDIPNLAFNLGVGENMKIGSYVCGFQYINHDSIECSIYGEPHFVFTRIN